MPLRAGSQRFPVVFLMLNTTFVAGMLFFRLYSHPTNNLDNDKVFSRCYAVSMTDVLTPTTTLDLLLPSGNHASVVYSASFGEIMIALLLAGMLALQVLQLWRGRRGAA